MTTSVTHDFCTATDSEGRTTPSDDSSLGTEASKLDLAARCLQTSRLPCLTRLHISAVTDLSLLTALARLGHSSSGRLTSVTLAGPGIPSSAACLLCLACPRLQELVLESSIGNDGRNRQLMELQRDVLEPLLGLSLKQLEVRPPLIVPTASLHTLFGLTRLQHLRMSVLDPLLSLVGPPPGWSRLRSLTSLELNTVFMTLADAAPLLALTQLHHLRVSTWRRISHAADGASAAALQQLGQLTNLQSLRLDGRFEVDLAAFDAIRRLTRLTQLSICRILELGCRPPPPPGAAAGHLPALQYLEVSCLSPIQLLETLLPLLPLPSLRRIGTRDGICLFLDCRPCQQDAAAAALAAAAQHLHDAPHLAPLRLALVANSAASDLPLRRAAEVMRPLAAHVTDLSLSCVTTNEEDWEAVGVCLPAVRRLTMFSPFLQPSSAPLGCAVSQGVGHLAALQSLTVRKGSQMSEKGWLRLAAAVARPLEVHVHAAGRAGLSLAVMALCKAEAKRVHGRCDVRFSVEENVS